MLGVGRLRPASHSRPPRDLFNTFAEAECLMRLIMGRAIVIDAKFRRVEAVFRGE